MKTRYVSQHFHTDQKTCLVLTVVARHETKSIINKVSSKTDETTRDRVRGRHLCNTVVHQTQEASIDGIREEQTARAALVETTADADEKSSSNGAANGHELDLTISKTPVEVVVVLDDLAIFVAVGPGDGGGRHKVVDLLAMFVRCHV